MNFKVKKQKSLTGNITVPGDKSVSHRALMFSALCKGETLITGISSGKDCLSTASVLKQTGCKIDFLSENTVKVNSKNALIQSATPLYCGNSGTSMRIFAGIFAGQNFETTLTGDNSLSQRPMRRIIEPLQMLGAKIEHNDFKAPLKIFGGNLHGIDYKSQLSSAQVKSAILCAGLFAEGKTTFEEPFPSRNHTEIMLKYLGANIEQISPVKTVIEKSELMPKDIQVCGDISSAAFFIVAALIVPGSDILIRNVGINPTRDGIIEIVKKAGGNIELLNERTVCGERVADISVKYTENLKSFEISGALVPRLIDEIPVAAVLATICEGTTTIKDSKDLKNKESDRISSTAAFLNAMGANVTATDDGMIIYGKTKLKGGVEVDALKDHRIAMSAYVAGLTCENPVSIKDFEWVDISFPEFEKLMSGLT